ncbi:TIGR04255 family protein [Anaerocolumna sp. AGMB13025]|uniref:TIGR04255 family protein n=1 Tax=Anaerocolumna sp. AGMB13025 TaxID=3039116 RepID=UPI00241D5B5F|nr:TIGR04255 family protein [Anaerocolumna sp. AGMB13025]WFR55051.1 TIGR04255 family protein [Anaerocolumna sp. AGMB13025]
MSQIHDKKDFKYNILNMIILRADYDGIFSVSGLIDNLQGKIKDKGFTDFISERNLNLYEKDSEDEKNSGVRVFVFKTKDGLIELKISEIFMEVRVRVEKYVNFQKYKNIFCDLLEEINKLQEFLACSKISIRKINRCFPYTIDDLFKGFKSEAFNTVYLHDDIKNYQNILDLKINDTDYQIVQFIAPVIVTDEKNQEINILQFIFDIVGTVKSMDISTLRDRMTTINDEIFHEIFTCIMNDSFIKCLKEGKCSELNIEGVKSND